MGLWNSFALFDETLHVKLNGLANERERILASIASGDAAWKVGDVRAPTGGTLLNDDGVLHDSRSLLKTGLLQDIIEGAWRNINVRFAGDGHGAGFRGMLELSVAAARVHLTPSVVLKLLDQRPDFHSVISKIFPAPPNDQGNPAAAKNL